MKITSLSILLIFVVSSFYGAKLLSQEDRPGIFISNSYSSLKRTTSFPFTPLADNQIQNWEFGLYFPVISRKYFHSSARLSYLKYGFSESFRFNQRESDVTFAFTGIHLALTPVGVKYDFGDIGFLIGGGGFGMYQLNGEVATSSLDYTYEEKIMEPFIYGGQANFGIRYRNFILSFSIYNSLSNVIKATNLASTNVFSIEVPDVPSKLRGGSLSLIITLPKKRNRNTTE